MQAPSIQDFPPNSKRRLELQNQHIQQLQQQQQQNGDDMICDNEEPPFKKPRPGVATNFLYKFAELAAYTSAFASEAINTITGSHVSRQSTSQNYDDDDDDEVLQIKTDDDDEEDDLCDQNLDKKDESAWTENVEEEEPPPPYDSSWSMPLPSTSNVKTPEMIATPVLSSSPSQTEFMTPQQPSTLQQTVTKLTTSTTSRRRQFRVRRGRRFLRRKSSSTDMSSNANASSTQPEDEEDDIFLKFNCKLADMIAEGKAALTSKADVTDVEMMLEEEKEREERILKECGIQTPINRRARRLTSSSSTSSEYEFYSSILSPGGHSNHSSDNGFSGVSSCYSSPTGYYPVDGGFASNRSVFGRSSPTQYGSSGFNSPVGFSNGYNGYNGYGCGSPSTFSPTTTTGGYEAFNNLGQNSKHGSSSGFGSNGVHNSRYF